MAIGFTIEPLVDGPIIGPGPAEPHQNINGPSLIRVPEWADASLGAYYLYYADHKGRQIELAAADELAGPWRVHPPGALALSDTPFLHAEPAVPESIDAASLSTPRAPGVPSVLDDCTIPHIASPEAIVDEKTQTVRLYYHGLDSFMNQVTRVAVSSDARRFESRDEVLAPSYLRVFRYRDAWYGLAMPGGLFRSEDGIGGFEAGPVLFGPDMRHAGLWLRGDELWVFWTRVGDAPERILLSTIDLRADWTQWRESAEVEVLRPTREWEGAAEPVEPSVRSSVDHRVNQLRDPFVFVEDDRSYLLYVVGGESGIAIARMKIRKP